ncbi:MAG TPA: acyltransferase [Candidatus Limnocylindria bacterium]|nr:acyltransferase [Candidatus Limnocylindria bacterium]
MTASTHSTPATGQPAKSRFPQLDGIRGLAILMVVGWHYFYSQLNFDGPLPRAVKIAAHACSLLWSGVDLFFVLSGFLITGILLDELRAKNLLSVFYLRRAARILPLYFLVLTAAAVGYGLVGHDPRFEPLFAHFPPVWSFLTFTQNILMAIQGGFAGPFLGMTWSLAVEEQFYLVWPWVVLLFAKSRRGLVVLTLLLCLLAPGLRLLVSSFTAFVNTPFRMDSLLFGALAAMIFRDAAMTGFLKAHRTLFHLAFAGLAPLVGLLLYRPGALGVWNHFVLGALYFGGLLYSLLFDESALSCWLSTGWLRWVGSVSYALYMFHEPIGGCLNALILGPGFSIITLPGVAVTLLSLCLSFGAAALSGRFFEAWFLRLGKRARYKF